MSVSNNTAWMQWKPSASAPSEGWTAYFDKLKSEKQQTTIDTPQTNPTNNLTFNLPSNNNGAEVDQLKGLLDNDQVNTDGDDTLSLEELQYAQDGIRNYLNSKLLTGLTASDIALGQQLNTLTFLTDINSNNGKTNFELLAGGQDEIEFDPMVFSDIQSKWGSVIDQNEINQLATTTTEFNSEIIDELFDGNDELSVSDLKEIQEEYGDLKPWEDGYEESRQISQLAENLINNFDKISITHEFEDNGDAVISQGEVESLFAKAGDEDTYTAADLNQLTSEINNRKITKPLLNSVFEEAGLSAKNSDDQKQLLETYLKGLLDKAEPSSDDNDAIRNAKTLLNNWDLLELGATGDSVSKENIDTYFKENGRLDHEKIEENVTAPFNGNSVILDTIFQHLEAESVTLEELEALLAEPPVDIDVKNNFFTGPQLSATPLFTENQLNQIEKLLAYLEVTKSEVTEIDANTF